MKKFNEYKEEISKMFDPEADRLPRWADMFPEDMDRDHDMFGGLGIGEYIERMMGSHSLRDKVLEYGFIAYTDELLSSLRRFLDRHTIFRLSELACGTGWFTHWMRKYGIKVQDAVDNKSWKFRTEYLPLVKEGDAAKYVTEHRDLDMFVLVWPYMSMTAREIWDAMAPGQYLFYIGEGWGGCTANDDFFKAVEGCDVELEGFDEVEKAFHNFHAIHDRPTLYRKK